jgi:hypothetical protein
MITPPTGVTEFALLNVPTPEIISMPLSILHPTVSDVEKTIISTSNSYDTCAGNGAISSQISVACTNEFNRNK